MGTQPSAGNQPVRGSEPLNVYYRRPTTRMGVEWLFRKSYYDTIAAQKRGETDNAARDEILGKTLRGELPIVVKAMGTQDVRTAIFLKEEFGIQRMILTNAVEAWREPELVRRSGVGVCLPPFRASGRHPDGFANNSYFLPLRAAKDLYDLGVPIALSARDGRQAGSRLANQAGFAMRGGLSFEAALAAVTLQPARMVGIDDTVGSIEAGKDADLVLWSGKPFEPTSQIVGVLLDGQLVVDPRTKRGENE
jgi:imidazolonepropionase-like amidohydrolase